MTNTKMKIKNINIIYNINIIWHINITNTTLPLCGIKQHYMTAFSSYVRKEGEKLLPM